MDKIKKALREAYYRGFLLMEGGFKIEFEISEEEIDEKLKDVADNLVWKFDSDDMIWLGSLTDVWIPARKIIGVNIYEFNKEV